MGDLPAGPDAVRGRRVLVGDELVPATVLIDRGVVTGIEPYDHPVDGLVLEAPEPAYVLPGVVDTHVHVNEPGRTEWEGFETGTTAALLGGVTTLIDMPLNSVPPTTTVAGLRAKQAAARDRVAVDVGFWGGAVPGNLDELEPLWAAGVMGFKCFLSPSGVEEFGHLDADQLTAAMREVARLDALLVVHAEDPAVLDRAPARPGPAYADFLASRPDEAETAAIAQVVRTARETGARVHLLHLSSARALDLVADAKAEGLALTAETCPHYLCLAAETIPDGDGAFKCCPPIRDEGNRDALWAALLDGVIDVVVTDHSPATVAEKTRGGGDLQQAWGGIAGLQVGFTAVAHEARLRGIGIEQVSRWMSQGTADLVGLGGEGGEGGEGLDRKGRIAVGADADLVLFDPDAEQVVDAARLAHRNPVSAYDGRRLTGRVVQTVVRGRTDGPDHRWGRQLTRRSNSR
ncbi:allantoinase AllB [Nocardioides campestrisoli]|uniref:allantoinase AllB n=1 Tax=Nocardioides campestrisoli TaxID=2736757 RepID=UPI00163D49EB|nr:allantoinase AllB [Nocardioides campestrisoli]